MPADTPLLNPCRFRTSLVSLAALALTALIADPAAAQGPISLGLGGGITMPRDRLESTAERGYHGLATVRLGVPLVPVHLRLDGLHARLGGLGATDDLEVTAATANLGYDVVPLAVAALYVVGGGGYYWTERTAPGAVRVRNTGWNAGAGIRLSLGKVRLFGEARYHTVRTDEGGTHFVPVTIGFSF